MHIITILFSIPIQYIKVNKIPIDFQLIPRALKYLTMTLPTIFT